MLVGIFVPIKTSLYPRLILMYKDHFIHQCLSIVSVSDKVYVLRILDIKQYVRKYLQQAYWLTLYRIYWLNSSIHVLDNDSLKYACRIYANTANVVVSTMSMRIKLIKKFYAYFSLWIAFLACLAKVLISTETEYM